MAKNKLTEVVSKVVELLTPLASEDRLRVMRASLTLLGQSASGTNLEEGKDESEGAADFNAMARAWIKQNSLTHGELEQVFHMADGTVTVIAADIPGKNKKEKTLNAYVLTGISHLLSSGKPAFDDKSARMLCQTAGCYDSPNHATTLKNKGNWFAGTKDKGWTLTAPGLKHGATLIKELNK